MASVSKSTIMCHQRAIGAPLCRAPGNEEGGALFPAAPPLRELPSAKLLVLLPPPPLPPLLPLVLMLLPVKAAKEAAERDPCAEAENA